MTKTDDLREKALSALEQQHVLMRNGHFDFGNGYHGAVYLNPHQLFRQPSTIWRFAQDLIDVLPGSVLEHTEVVAGPATGGALLAHTIAGLLDSRRDMSKPATLFAPFSAAGSDCSHALSDFYRRQVRGRRILIVDDVRNTGQTLATCVELARQAGGDVIATAQIYDRMESIVDTGVPNYPLAEYRAPANYPASECPLCRSGQTITTF